MTGTIALTGAAGFVGRAVAGRLRDEGYAVVGIDRLGGAGVLAADLCTAGAWQDRVRECDAVVHTAALVSQTAGWDAAWTANVVATRRVAEAVRPGARLVHCSSAAVYSPHKPDGVDEAHPVRPTGRTYGDTKIAGEHVVLSAAAAGTVDAVVLRPGDVYGPGSRPWTELPVEALRRGRLVLPAHGRGVVDVVHVDDLVDAILAALRAAAPPSRVYNVASGAPVTTGWLFGEYARRLGLAPPRATSTRRASLLAEVVGRAQRLRGVPSELGAATMAMLAKTGSISPARAVAELGWRPRVPIEEGIARTVAALGARATSGAAPS